MSYSRKFIDNLPFNDSLIDTDLLYDYLTMNVPDAEYPTAVPAFALSLVLGGSYAIASQAASALGLFGAGQDHQHGKRAFLQIDGPDEDTPTRRR
tara:strand:- start:1097 stop:1381 length:285 start_codon:yes stop_codon:yes gene_type:complete